MDVSHSLFRIELGHSLKNQAFGALSKTYLLRILLRNTFKYLSKTDFLDQLRNILLKKRGQHAVTPIKSAKQHIKDSAP